MFSAQREFILFVGADLVSAHPDNLQNWHKVYI